MIDDDHDQSRFPSSAALLFPLFLCGLPVLLPLLLPLLPLPLLACCAVCVAAQELLVSPALASLPALSLLPAASSGRPR